MTDQADGLLRTVRLVAILNLTYFGIEFAVARTIGSVSLFADSIDFLEDASVNFLILIALGWGAAKRARIEMGLAAILLVPGFAALWTAWQKFSMLVPARTHSVITRRSWCVRSKSVMCDSVDSFSPSRR